MDARIEQVVTSGKVTLDDTDYDVENNTYIVGDDDEVIVIDPAHDAEAILKEVGDREVMAVLLTDGNEHRLNVVLEVAAAGEEDEDNWAPIALHRADRLLWRDFFGRLAKEEDDEDDAKALRALEPDIWLEDGGVFEIGGAQLEIVHTPGHTPGSVCVISEQLGALFSGDTLHRGRPGSIGGVYEDLRGQLNSIGALLTPLPKELKVLPAQGEETTVGDEDSRWETWGELAQDED
ncbi:glyoxylase-like metal-dependent hydrolase (beta-lactamase superfamily II) [Actinomadura hallensis]|uniref:Glyoxylase-like metal-dependent hydrolase (Beta-lactamase superfamily II) n=1 Tax=Actinomadura hallensis TaxID=337895 RepID=A0A543IB55_9ACTN|nr:MBL fold metallo-hydrolase [Actinomadura hallensis]TQM67780.1 glyoxylase-like metal-dependent hydrolase (beta-lactamase superfamily II) [Actinomadura hallensis]